MCVCLIARMMDLYNCLFFIAKSLSVSVETDGVKERLAALLLKLLEQLLNFILHVVRVRDLQIWRIIEPRQGSSRI